LGNQIIPSGSAAPAVPPGARLSRQTERALARIEGSTLVRAASVRAEAIVAGEKMEEIDYLTWKAMNGHAMMRGFANHLAGEDLILQDELRFYIDAARLAKGGVLADVVDTYRHI
jgi:hypothetical protein